MSKSNFKIQFFRQPRYYSNFHCLGGSCPYVCCQEWDVRMRDYEIKKLESADCSEHLRKLMKSSFKEHGKMYAIQMDDNQRCPFLTDDNFCSIQRELGEEYIFYTCRIYPRDFLISGNTLLKYCYLSCYHVIDMICNDSGSMILDNYTQSGEKIIAAGDSETDFLNHPELKYRQQLFEFFYEVISDDSHSIETSITLGAIAARCLEKCISAGEYAGIPGTINSLRSQLKDPNQIKKLEELNPNYAVKLGFAVKLNQIIMNSDLIGDICENGGISIAKYNEGMARFCEIFSDRPFALRNIALNLLLEFKMPFRDKTYRIFENYCYFVAAFAEIKLVAASIFANSSKTESDFKIASAYVSRSFASNDSKVKQIIDLFKELNCMSPAYIALIVK